MLLLNVGSGQRPFGVGWTNVDINPKWNPDVVAPGNALPFEDGTVDMVVLHHVLEHEGCGGGGLLEEAYRVLKRGGSLLVFVPDMLALARGWLEGRIADQVYLTNIYGAYMDSEADRHKWGYTHDSLHKVLHGVGFGPVHSFDWEEIDGASIARDWWILAMRAIK